MLALRREHVIFIDLAEIRGIKEPSIIKLYQRDGEGRTEANNALKPGSPKKKQAALIAEKAMKSHIAKRMTRRKLALAGWCYCHHRGCGGLFGCDAVPRRAGESLSTWWDNEWMDEQEDFSDDISIQQRNREIKMDENKEKRNAKRGSKDKAKEKSKRRRNPARRRMTIRRTSRRDSIVKIGR